ncbi:M36 family metallopeptidase [Steroidobacter flavus]|uniref:M36 family metallopeptidase n=1 Tax=Steroidobacter flavus TaxID=1842136 RepID=A0ABV8T531_9GAMM
MNRCRGFAVVSISFACGVCWSTLTGAQEISPTQDAERHFDARLDLNRGFSAARSAAAVQPQSIQGLVANVEELTVESNETTGAVSSLSSQRGYLTGTSKSRPMDLAMAFIRSNVAALGLEASDLQGYVVSDVVYSRVTGATHIYLQQRHAGIPVYNAQLQVNVNRDGRIISVNNSFLPGLAQSVGALKPSMPLREAVSAAAKFSGIAVPTKTTKGRLMLLPIRRGEARLVWNFQINTLDEQHTWDFTVDAENGQVWTRFDGTVADQYRVYPQPVESPTHTSPLPPSDGRTLVVNPANSLASPFGWHDTNGAAGAEFTTTQGNNVEAYTDTDNNNSPDSGSSPSGGSALNFDFAINLSGAPSTYRPSAVTNLFYWNNIIHDVQYQYGFDEAAGNFQVNNYGRGGAGNDSVRAEAQDGGGTNNANFATPADGSRPRMQMYVWTSPNPDRDGDLDAGIVVHEYGHGISNRLIGGPSNVNCLTNRQQPGEGLSDWWALAYTARASDTGATPRGMGTYALGQATTGAGIRTQRYSTDPAVNTWTYASINGMAVPHGVGSVWAQAAWEVYWKLVDQWGFNANLYNATGSAGNQRMMLYVNEGLKNTACNPTFTQVRDGIIQAATDNHGGEDVCRVWEAFAAFGLGSNAVSGGSASTTPTNGFDVPASCTGGGGTVVFEDTFETSLGWQTNPNGTDTAVSGAWERGDPEATTSSGTKQLGTTTSGTNGLVTARLAGASAGENDVDGGITSIRSPAITLPATGTLTLSFSQYLAHGSNATNADFLRVSVVGATTSVVFQRLGAAANVDGAWSTASASLNAFAGQTVRLLIEAADAGTASLVEAGIDDVRITQQ